MFPIHGWVEKYWTTLLEIQLTDVKFSNFPGAAARLPASDAGSLCLCICVWDSGFNVCLQGRMFCDAGCLKQDGQPAHHESGRQVKGICGPGHGMMASGLAGGRICGERALRAVI